MYRSLIIGFFVCSIFLVGCSDNGGGQSAIDQAADVAGNAVDATKEATGDAMEYTGEKMQEAGEAVSETGQSMKSE